MNDVVTIELSAPDGPSGIFAILSKMLPVRFVAVGEARNAACGAIRIGSSGKVAILPHGDRFSAPAPAAPDPTRARTQVEHDVHFRDDPHVPFPFRGRTVRTSLGDGWKPLQMRAEDRALATVADGAVWSVSTGSGPRHFRSALPMPRIADGAGFVDAFSGSGFAATLPLLEFVRRQCASLRYEPAPLRAAFIIDDPNLHWHRYGYVDYRSLAEHARRVNFHVAFAMIPMDTWFTHGPTAAILRDNAEFLSLLVHGNNHSREELAQDYTTTATEALLRQALGRIARFEAKTGLSVDRVMVPPHGACSSRMLAAMPAAGFDAACISTGSLRAYNAGEPWSTAAGFAPCETIGGCPVLPRWALSGPLDNSLLCAAYLGQPLVVRGHHIDLKDGVDTLSRVARKINAFGDVRWSSLAALSRLNYEWRMDGTTCHLRPYGAVTEFRLPSAAVRLRIDAGSPLATGSWAITSRGAVSSTARTGEAFDTARFEHDTIVVRRKAPTVAASAPAWPRATPKVILRRILTEARDRLRIG